MPTSLAFCILVFRAQNALNSDNSIRIPSQSILLLFSKSFSEVYLDGQGFQVPNILVFILLISSAKSPSL